MRIAAGIGIAALLAAAPAAFAAPRIEESKLKIAGLDVTSWSDKAAGDAKLPVIVFSHGFHGCATQSRFLMRALAAAGYLVLAPNHKDATCANGGARWSEPAAQPLGRPDQWTDATYRDRAQDIARLVDAISRDAQLTARADLVRLGLAGHSLGGYTVLGLAGAWPAWKLDGVKAVLALSPYAQPFNASGTIARLAVPVMYQGGTVDLGITPALRRPSGAYDRSPAPKYYVELDGAGHFAWTDMRATFHETIAAYGVAFMDRYVKGETGSPLLEQKRAGVSALRHLDR